MTTTKLPNPANQNLAPNKINKRQHRDWSGAGLLLSIAIFGLVLGRLGHLWIAFDVFSQLSLQFMFLGLAMIMGLVFPRFKGLAGIILFLVMVVGYALWPQLLGRSSDTSVAPTGKQKLKVASFNTLSGNHDYAGIAAALLAIDADVVSLIEFGPEKKSVLDALRTIYPYQIDCYTSPECDQVVISKIPLTDPATQDAGKGPAFIRASLGPQYGNVMVFAVHTARFPHAFYQFRQIQAFTKTVEAWPGRVIIMGDFNATPFSRVTQTLSNSLDVKRVTSLPSWPATYSFPQLAIDHIFVSQDIIALDQERLGHNAGSDHFPISITLAIPQK